MTATSAGFNSGQRLHTATQAWDSASLIESPSSARVPSKSKKIAFSCTLNPTHRLARLFRVQPPRCAHHTLGGHDDQPAAEAARGARASDHSAGAREYGRSTATNSLSSPPGRTTRSPPTAPKPVALFRLVQAESKAPGSGQ